jgi:spore germination cell wall hydrolase CwlJ-like protein
MREIVVMVIVVFAYLLASNEAQAAPLDEKRCLALNIYHEARGEGKEGMMAVANVTMNRVRSSAYPSTVCKVVYQHKQFSWVLDTRVNPVVRLTPEIMQIAKLAVTGNLVDMTKGSTHFHTTKVKPYWARHKKQTVVIGNHIFYKSTNQRKKVNK